MKGKAPTGTSEKTAIDPVTFAVIKNKLRSIVDEQTLAIQRMSGSPVVNEASDFNNGLFLPESGTSLQMGLRALLHADSLGKMVRSISKECKDNPGISRDDQFYCNDPWRGAIHQSDCGLVAPIFYKNELVAWSGCLAHQIDIGGAHFGSWIPLAQDVYQEAVPIPPIRLVESGRLRRDIWNMLLAHSRLPFLFGLDLKAFIGANNVVKRRFLELADRYGIGTVKAVMNGMVESTESRLRERLREIPDGTYRSVAFLNHDGHQNRLYKIAVTATKKNDTLAIDFTGTDRQAPGFINITESSTLGAVATVVLSCLCFDFDWNGGVFGPLKVKVPSGTLTSAEFPAPVSGGSVNIQFVAIGALHQLCALMLACTDKYRGTEVSAAPGYYAVIFNLGGLNQFGEPFGTMLTDSQATGEGAYSFKDGAPVHMMADTPAANIADIESVENVTPIIYLYRRIVADTGGAGKWKGGNGGGAAFTSHDADALSGVLVGTGNETPQPGLFGGLVGGCNRNVVVRKSNVNDRFRQGRSASNLDELEGEKKDLGTKPGALSVLPGDVFDITFQGAGGYGDPLEREPARVLQDVLARRVSVKCAGSLYGVVIDPQTLKLDAGLTNKRRKAMLKRRLALGKGARRVAQREAEKAVRLMSIGEYLEVVRIGREKVVRCRCGYQFGTSDRNWKESAILLKPPARAAGPYVRLHRDLEIRQYLCPECGRSLCTEVARKGDEILFEVEPAK
jgi:N-methylhydantoinase B